MKLLILTNEFKMQIKFKRKYTFFATGRIILAIFSCARRRISSTLWSMIVANTRLKRS